MTESRQTPPHSIEAEEAILGGIFIDSSAIDRVVGAITPDDFYRQANRQIFQVMLDCQQAGQDVDLVTVADRLAGKGTLIEVGGAAYLAELAERIPTAANIAHHAKIVREKAQLRAAINLGAEIALRGYEAQPLALTQVRALAEQIVDLGAGDEVDQTWSQSVVDVVAGIERRAAGEMPVMWGTGLREVDAMLGGFFPKRHYLIAGRTSQGKSQAALCFTRHIASTLGIGVGIVSCEMSREQCIQRLVSMESGVPLTAIRRKVMEGRWLTDSLAAAERVASWPLHVVDRVTDLAGVERSIRDMARHGARVVVVDHVGLVRHPNAKLQPWTAVGEIGKALRRLAISLEIAVLTLVQVNREVKNQKDFRPQLWNLRDAGSLEEDADAVMFVHRPFMYDKSADQQAAEVIIAKDRDGETGIIQVAWNPKTASFEDAPDDITWGNDAAGTGQEERPWSV